jgi:hypothetical protein
MQFLLFGMCNRNWYKSGSLGGGSDANREMYPRQGMRVSYHERDFYWTLKNNRPLFVVG